MAVRLPFGVGLDRSANKPIILPLLTTIPVNENRRGLYVQNQSGNQLQIILDQDDFGTNPTIILVDPGNGPNGQGADWSMHQMGFLHVNRIRICGQAGTQFAAREY